MIESLTFFVLFLFCFCLVFVLKNNILNKQSHEDAVKFLVSAGADKSVKGPDGLDALGAAEKQAIKDALSARPAPPARRK